MAALLLIVGSILAFGSNVPAFIWFARKRIAGPTCLSLWILLHNGLSAVNATVWAHSAEDKAPGACLLISSRPKNLSAARLLFYRIRL